jgi:bifunctional DNA-binding transcriptional regulator/antitoxin component of YhaV-PrlF toxin-antitoxin module
MLDNLVLVPIFTGSKSLHSEDNMPSVYSSTTARNPLSFETRRVQSNGQSLITVLPKIFADRLGIERGDLVRFYMNNDDKRKIMLEKISTEESPPINEGVTEIGGQ